MSLPEARSSSMYSIFSPEMPAGVVDVSVGAGDGDNFCTELACLKGCAPCYISEAGYGHGLACYGLVAQCEHIVYEIDSSESGCFGTDARATEVEPFSGECAVVFLNEFLVHSVHVSDLTASYADIAGGYVAVGAYILPKGQA